MDSIHSQSYLEFEHIVMDGLSTDATLDIIKEYDKVHLFSEKDKGQTDALNKGFALTKGDILAWQNADDIYVPDTFLTVVEFFKANPDVDVVYGMYKVIDEKGVWQCDVNIKNWDLWKFSHGRFVPMQPATFWRRNVYEKNTTLDINLKYCMDVDFFAKASKSFKFQAIPVFLGMFRVHSESKTHNPANKVSVLKEMRDVLAKNYQYTFVDDAVFLFFALRSWIAEFVKTKLFRKVNV